MHDKWQTAPVILPLLPPKGLTGLLTTNSPRTPSCSIPAHLRILLDVTLRPGFPLLRLRAGLMGGVQERVRRGSLLLPRQC